MTEQAKNQHIGLLLCYDTHSKRRRIRMYAIQTTGLTKRYKQITAVDRLHL